MKVVLLSVFSFSVFLYEAHTGINFYENTSLFQVVPTSGWGVSQNFLNGAYVSDNGVNIENSSISLRVAFDTDSLRMWVDRLTFNLAFAPKTLTAQIADVNGNLKSITTVIKISPISLSWRESHWIDPNAIQYRSIFQGTGGAYGLTTRTINTGTVGFNVSPVIEGSYTTQGPTQTRSGNFQVSLNNVYLTLPDFINLANPEQKVIFASGLDTAPLSFSFLPNNSLPVIYSVVDDVNLAVGLNLSSFKLTDSQFELQAIPEPSALSLFALGLGVLFRRSRKRD